MLLRSAIARLGQAAFIVACLALPAAAERIDVSPDEADLQAVLDRAADCRAASTAARSESRAG